MPLWPCSLSISANRNATSVSGFWRPVSTLASLIAVLSGRVTEESLSHAMRSAEASFVESAVSGLPAFDVMTGISFMVASLVVEAGTTLDEANLSDNRPHE